MADLTRHGSQVESVFDLLGREENDLTAALGFALTRSDAFMSALLGHIDPSGGAPAEVSAALEVRGEVGRTDLEISTPGGVLIIEAKRGWALPTTAQLASYAPRVLARGGGALVTLSQASRELARSLLPSQIQGVPVIHLPWLDVMQMLTAVRGAERGRRRFWLDQFQAYLTKVINVRLPADSWTYCVAVSDGRPADGGPLTFREYVTEELHYFHPYGVSGWPLEPPNFMAFRWQGSVQRIHRVIKADVVPRLTDRWPDIPTVPDTVRPHVVRLDNSTTKRQDLAHRLRTAGCSVNLDGTDWHQEGDLTPPAPPGGGLPLGRKHPSSQASGQPRLEVTLSKTGKDNERMTITNHGPGDVYDLDFSLLDDREGTRAWRDEGFPVPKLPAGKSVGAARFLTFGSDSPAYFTVLLTGKTADGVEIRQEEFVSGR